MKSSKIEFPKINDYSIVVENLKIVYEENTENENIVLSNFNYVFKKGKIYFIIGNSGSGKTTLVSHFNALLKSKYGNIYVEDIPILGSKRKVKQFKKLRKTVGMVFQFPEYQLFKDTIEKDIMFGPIALGDSRQIAQKKAKKYLLKMGLPLSYLPRSPFGLSGGQKRRVAIAGILAIEPKMLVFDEPTAGLDPAGEKEMMGIIRQAKNDGKTVFVITHVMDQVLELGDEVLVLDNKKLLVSGKPYDVFTNEKIMKKTTLDVPKVIKVINSLVKKDNKFKKLLEIKPKNVNELSKAILDIINKDK